MKTLATTRLCIKDQNELLNQISGTYKDFYRAAMEYVDNAIDAAEITNKKTGRIDFVIKVNVDTKCRKVTFLDNCGGMNPSELCNLLREVGRSEKKIIPWANGQCGFGVHAFRAFAAHAVFTSYKSDEPHASITIDRSFDEHKDVQCIATKCSQIKECGTLVEISKFDRSAFKKNEIFNRLANEIERHFDDVLRRGMIKILISEDGSKSHKCKYFDYTKIDGEELKDTIPINNGDKKAQINIDLKVLYKTQEGRAPVITNKQRRVQNIADLKSYKNYLRYKDASNLVWSNPFVVGFVEINDLCSPNLTRDDLVASEGRELLYDRLYTIQEKLQDLVDDIMNRKASESYEKFSNLISDCLSNVLKGFKLKYERYIPSSVDGAEQDELDDVGEGVPFGGNSEGGSSGSLKEPQNDPRGASEQGTPQTGDSDKHGGEGEVDKGSKEGSSKSIVKQAPGPKIMFQAHAGEDRVIDLEHSLIINTQHQDFIERNRGGSKGIKLDARLINYISIVVAPFCVHRLFEKSGRVPTPIEVGSNMIDLSTKLEYTLISLALGQEIHEHATI